MSKRNAGSVLQLLALTRDSLRLMVGIGSYAAYLGHMEKMHPDAVPMSEQEYFRYCQEARYPGKSGAIKRCPC